MLKYNVTFDNESVFSFQFISGFNHVTITDAGSPVIQKEKLCMQFRVY